VRGDGLKLSLTDGSRQQIRGVLLATGYKIDLARYDILDEVLKKNIRRARYSCLGRRSGSLEVDGAILQIHEALPRGPGKHTGIVAAQGSEHGLDGNVVFPDQR